MKIIAERFYNQSQSWHYERVVKGSGEKLRVLICRNAYDFQSYLRGYVYDQQSKEWHLLVDRPITGAACVPASYAQRDPDRSLFHADADAILAEMQAIVSR